MDMNRKLILKRLLSAAITLIMTLALLPVAYHFIGSTGGGFDSYAAGKRMEIIANQTLYVQSGGENVVSIKVKNNSGTEIRGVNFADGFGSAEDYSKYANDKPYNYTDGSSKRKTTDPVYGDEEEWYRFSPYFEEDGYNAVNAVWDSDEEGYTIAAGATATLWFKIKSEDEDPGEYTEWIKLGNTHTEWFGGFLPLTIVDEVYSDEMSVKVVTYNPSTAALAHGTSSNYGEGIHYVHPGSTIDIGTIDISKNTGLSGEKYYYTKNKTTISSGGDEHGNTQNIKVNFDFDSNNTQTADEGLLSSPLAHDRTFVNNDLPPVSGSTITAKETRISYDASDFVAGTYNATLTLRTIPHNVNVNEKAGNNNGVYTWPVKITLEGQNPRIPKAPEDVTATPGNGQVELTWNAAQEGAEEGMTYYVWRREGSESDSANKDNASFDWSKYSEVGSDSPDEDGRYLFVDGTAVNGKTYTYVVIGSVPLKAYPALSKSVKPLSSLQTRILAPEVSGNEKPGGNLLSWRMNGAYDGFSNNGSSLVDHFNVYRDGVLVAQVNQNAVIEDYEYESYYDEEAGTYKNKVVSTASNWEAFVETPVTDQDYTWNVACVSKSGVEGYWSDDIQGIGCDDRTCTITGHTAVSTVNYEGELCNEISLNVSAYNGREKVEYWRAEGDAEPDTSKAPYFSNSDSKYDVDTDFTDRNVSRDKTYTYAARVTDTYGNVSELYTFKVHVGTSNWFLDSYSSSDVSWKVIKGKEARLSWHVDTDEKNNPIGVYEVCRNGAVIRTYTAGQADEGYFEITDNPGTDGTYVYRMDKVINDIRIRGREYTFTRNTAKVNEDEFLKVPGTPTFDVKISEGKPVLRWAASDNGGRTEGYHIYRKDAGEFVNGEYLFTPNEWSSPYRKYWSNRRYISIDDPNANVLVDGDGYYKDDFQYGELTRINWEESDCPHEYWITAYNQAGESEPSKIVSFEFQGLDSNNNPIIPVNESKYKPGKPTIKKVWVDWEDGSNRLKDWDTGIAGKVHVSWDDAASSEGSIDRWIVEFSGLSNGYSDNDLQSWETAQYSGAKKGLSSVSPYITVNAKTGENGDYGRTAGVTVEAINSAGTALSDAVSQTIYSFPRFRVNAGDGKAKLEWTDLYNDSSATVNSWEILRRREGGSWQTVTTISKSDLDYEKDGSKYVTDSKGTKNYTWTDDAVQNGWKYEYRLVAKCTDNIDRSSVVRKVIPTKNSATKAPGAPQNFSAQKVNGEVLFTWDEPATGEAQYYQLMCEQSWGDSKYWTDMGSVNAPSTSYVWSPYEAETSRFFVYAYSYINGQESPKSNIYAKTLDEMYPNHSDIITVTVTEADIRGQATDYPGSFSLKATPGENKVDLSWDSSERATYYELRRYRLDNEVDDFNNITLPGSATSYSDTTALAGVRYEYRLYAGNRCGEIYDSTYATPAGKSKDQIIAEEVEALIEALPEPAAITAGDADAVNAVKERYDDLTAKQKKLVTTGDREKLEACVNALEQLELLEKYRGTVQPVQDGINALKPDEITSENLDAKKTEVAGVRADYEAISPAEAKKIVDTSNLVAAENKIRSLEKEAEDRNVVNELINDLNNLVTADQVNGSNADEVITAAEALQSRINTLTSDQRSIFESDARSGGLVEKLNATANQANAVLGRDHDHIMQKIAATKSTCARNGNIEYYKCTACGHFFRDQNGAEEISETDTILPLDATAHSWGEWKATSTALCTKGGIEERVCKNSSLHRESRSVPATGHNWDNGTVKKPSTTEQEGEIEYKCTVCEATRIDKVDKIPADATGICETGAHTWGDPEEVKKPNCTEPGEIRYTCTTCHVIKRYQTDTDPTKHVWRNADKNDGWSIEKEATCSESGSETRRCELCDMKESRVIDASGHDWDEPERKAATCSEKGYVKFTCKRCKYTYTDVIDIDPNAHRLSAWNTTRAATCTSKGDRERHCTVDGCTYSETGTLNALGHSYSSWVSANPTEESQGVMTHRCNRCGHSFATAIAPIVLPTDLPYVKVSKPAKAKKAITVKWKKPKKKQLSQIGGIEIQVTGPTGTFTTTAGRKKTSKKIKGLLPKQTYSCRVRAYNYIGGVKHVSAWSNWKSTKTK